MAEKSGFQVDLPGGLAEQACILAAQIIRGGHRHRAQRSDCRLGGELDARIFLRSILGNPFWAEASSHLQVFLWPVFLLGLGAALVGSPARQSCAGAIVQRKHRRLGDRLVSAVELADHEQRPEDVSEAYVGRRLNRLTASPSDFHLMKRRDPQAVDVFADGHLRVGRLVFHGRLHSGRQPECTQTLGLVQ